MAAGRRDSVVEQPSSSVAAALPGTGQVAWRPTEAHWSRSRLRRFMAAHGIETLEELQQRSVADIAWYWEAVVRDLDLEFFTPYNQLLDLSRGLPWPRWFVGGRYNYVHNAVDRQASGAPASRVAIVWEGEDGAVRRLTYGELAEATSQLAWGLQQLGIGPGDRVGIFLPMVPEVAIATLACGKLGAVFIPIFSGYAATAVATRLRDCGAKALIAADGFYRRGTVVPMGQTALEAAGQVPSVEKVIVFRRLGNLPLPADPRVVAWDDLPASPLPDFATVKTAADDPYMIIYTSGTTGRPKGTVHLQAGFPIKASHDLAYCFDLQSDDTLFWLTDIGWMMGPWAIAGGLTLGATLLFYEGAIDFPKPDRLWDLVERHRVTLLGISPTAVRALMTRGESWVRAHDLSSLRAFGSTGEPWNPNPWWWLFRQVGGERCPILNYSGGTEISGGIVGGFTIAPLKPGAFAGPVPGMDVDVVDEQGQSVRGAVGELVIRQPWVGMTNGFWQDPDRYVETYWSRWPNVWVHGDRAMVDGDGAWYILGRSDDTIKLAGKRVGPAEVESAAVAHPAVAEAAAIGVPDEVKGEALVVLAILRPDAAPSEALRQEIRESVAQQLGRALRPEVVRFVADLPRTRNAKILRRVARGAYLGRTDLGDLSSLENPAAIEAIRAGT
jgi:acetyl-CoA synthetase